MSTKKFTVIDTRTMQKKSFNSEATTVAQLKAELNRLGISTEGMIIQEGLTKTEFISDAALLPHDVPYKGGTTNNLVFRITQAEKKIKSGAEMTRKEAYDQVKALGLTEHIATKYGKNFTMCKTADLIAEIEAACPKATNKKPNCEKLPKEAPTNNVGDDRVAKAITLLTTKLVNNGVLSPEEGMDIVDMVGTTLDIEKSTYSAEELDDMFEDM